MSIDMLAHALRDAARRHGAQVTVATTVAEALGTGGGGAVVALSQRRGEATVEMTRGPLPHEGGALHVDLVDVVTEDGSLRPATLAWIEEWGAAMAAIERHGQAMASSGTDPDGIPPWGLRIDAAAHAVLSAAGHDAARLLAGAGWWRSDSGFSTKIAEEGIEADVDRYLDLVRFRLLRVPRRGGDVQYEETGDAVHITIETREPLPETLITASEGRPLSCLMASDAVEPPGNVVRSAYQSGGSLVVTADTDHQRIAIPTKEKAA